MAYFEIAKGSDLRTSKGCTPISLQNMMLEKSADSSADRARLMLVPTPGRTRRVDFGYNVRGLFAEPGVQDGLVFAAAAGNVFRVSTTYSADPIGAIIGSDIVQMRGQRAKLITRAFNTIYQYNGTWTAVTDADAPAQPYTLAVVANRVVAADRGSDTFNWSVAGDPTTWDSAGIAADVNLPDPIVGQENYRGDLISLNARSIQFWRPTDATEDQAFAPLPADIRRGLFARDAIAPVGDGDYIFLGSDRVVYRTSGYGVQPIAHRDLETAIGPLADEILTGSVAWSYRDGSRDCWALNVGLDRAFVYDASVGAWHNRTRWGASSYDVDFACTAYGKTFVASSESPYLWTLEPDVYTDDGNTIERVMTLHVPVGGGASVDRLVFDLQVRDQPIGATPRMMVSFSRDGGNIWSTDLGLERTVMLPTTGQYSKRVQITQLGRAEAEHGFLLKIRMTDPVYLALRGVWVNPGADELR